ncbi:unnamed protein product, partial [Symbiodinium pilosum]
RNCHAGILASECRLQAAGNQFQSIKFGAVQLFNSHAELEGNVLADCGVGVSLRAGLRDRIAGATECRLRTNVIRKCEIGLKVCSAQGGRVQCGASEDSFTENGDGLVVQGPGARVRLERCQICRCQRGGAHVAKDARLELDSCELLDNGRGVVMAGGSSADVQRCCFEGNTGWAIRLESEPALAASPQVTCITGNVFGSQLRGNAGRKRIRVDARDVLPVVMDNVEPEGEAVEA